MTPRSDKHIRDAQTAQRARAKIEAALEKLAATRAKAKARRTQKRLAENPPHYIEKD